MIALVLVAALVLLGGCGGDDDERTTAPARPPVLGALQQGGLTLVMRHATTDTAVAQQERLGSCASQRNLTAAGREQARAIGRAVRALRIPIGDVRASPLCRTRQTAELAFGRATVDRVLVSPGIAGSEADDRRRARALRAFADRGPAQRDNAVLVTHTGNLGAAFGQEDVEEGEVLAYAPGGRLVGRVRAEEWPRLVRAAA